MSNLVKLDNQPPVKPPRFPMLPVLGAGALAGGYAIAQGGVWLAVVVFALCLVAYFSWLYLFLRRKH